MFTVTINVNTMVSVDEDVDVDLRDIVDDLSDDDVRALREPLERRLSSGGKGRGDLLEASFLAMRARGDCPEPLRDYFWQVLGRVL